MKLINKIIKKELFYYYFLGLGTLFTLFLFTFRLSFLNTGMNKYEINTINSSSSLSDLINNSSNLPYRVFIYLTNNIHPHHIFFYRLTSVIWALLFIYIFYLVIKKKFGPNIATILGLLLMTSAWVLHTSRTAVPDVLYLSTILIFWFREYLKENRNLNKLFLVLVSMIVFYLYVPGMIWIGLIGILWQRKIIKELLSRLERKYILLIGFYGLVLLIPLIFSIVHQPSSLFTIIGLPNTFPDLLKTSTNLLLLPYNILISMQQNSILWLGVAPLFDFFTSSLVLFGLYRYIREWPNNYIKIILVTILAASFLYALGGPVTITMLIGSLYLVAATGLSFLITKWFRVFPKNPIPRILGSLLIILAVFVAVIYNTRSYFVAWPNNSKTSQYYKNLP